MPSCAWPSSTSSGTAPPRAPRPPTDPGLTLPHCQGLPWATCARCVTLRPDLTRLYRIPGLRSLGLPLPLPEIGALLDAGVALTDVLRRQLDADARCAVASGREQVVKPSAEHGVGGDPLL